MPDPTPATGEAARGIDLDAIERAAKAASPGPWYLTGDPWFRDSTGVLAGSPDGNIAFVIADCEAIGCERDDYEGPFRLSDAEADAAFIATLDPPTALALVARVRSAEAERDDVAQDVDDLEGRLRSAETARDAALARVKELEAGLGPIVEEALEGRFVPMADRKRAARLLAGKDDADG